MPVSAVDHRVKTGGSSNRFRKKTAGKRVDEIGKKSDDNFDSNVYDIVSQITQVENSAAELEAQSGARPARQSAAATAVQLMLLLNHVRPSESMPPLATNKSSSVMDNDRPWPLQRFETLPARPAAADKNVGHVSATPLGPRASQEIDAEMLMQACGRLKRSAASNNDLSNKQNQTSALIASSDACSKSAQAPSTDVLLDEAVSLEPKRPDNSTCVTVLDTPPDIHTRVKRISLADRNRLIAEHIEEYCAYEEELLSLEGEDQDKWLLLQAQRAENPFRMIYDDRSGRPSPEARGLADGLNFASDVLTLGIKPLIGALVASAKRRQYYRGRGDDICAERFRQIAIAHVVTSADVTGLRFTARGSFGPPLSKGALPGQLSPLPPSLPAKGHSKIPNEAPRLPELTEGAINGEHRQNGARQKTQQMPDVPSESRAVVASQSKNRGRMSSGRSAARRHQGSAASLSIDPRFGEGGKRIELAGQQQELRARGEGKFYITIEKGPAVREFVPVYMEPISRTWHMSISDGQSAFNGIQKNILKEIAAEKNLALRYIPARHRNRRFRDAGKIYRVEKNYGVSPSERGRYIEMNGQLVPVRKTKHRGPGTLYEVYDKKRGIETGYPVEWDGRRWIFERRTSVHVSTKLRNAITPDDFATNIDPSLLSAPDHVGFRFDAQDTKYVKVDNRFVRIDGTAPHYSINRRNGDKLHIEYKKNKYWPVKLESRNGALSSNPAAIKRDRAMYSRSGLQLSRERMLNDAWTLKEIGIKNSDFNNARAVGSRIDVTFTMAYRKSGGGKRFEEMPVLEWKEAIKFKRGNSIWHFRTDMYSHHPASPTFFPWRNRYVEAYRYAKAADKHAFHGNVAIYKENMAPVGIKDIKDAHSPEEMVANVQRYLHRNGGVMKITITDRPQIFRRAEVESAERTVRFSLGFKARSSVRFNQGISLRPGASADAFVTTSDSINLAKGRTNVPPPPIVITPRKHALLEGEVL